MLGDGSESSKEAVDGERSSWYHWFENLIVRSSTKPVTEPEPQSFLQQLIDLSVYIFSSVLHITKSAVILIFSYAKYSMTILRDGLGVVVSGTSDYMPEMLTQQRWSFMALILTAFVILSTCAVWICLSRRKQTGRDTGIMNGIPGLMCVSPRGSLNRRKVQPARVWYHWFAWGVLWLVILASLLSIPWEFIRLYQNEVAKRAAVIHGGLPADCDPQSLSLWQTVKSWLQWHFSWSDHSPCEQYHKALLVDPLWEVTPMLVLSSVLTRCIGHPIEVLSGTLGRCLKYFFVEIPAQWQPVIMVVILLLCLTLLLMTCRYRLRLPLFFVFEPKAPTDSHVQSRRPLVTRVPSRLRIEETSMKQKSRNEIVSDPNVITKRKKGKTKNPKYG